MYISKRSLAAQQIPIRYFYMLLAIGFCGISFSFYHDYRVTTGIQQHGQRQEARVLDIYHRIGHSRKSNRCDVIADYQITPKGWNGPLSLAARLGDCNQDNSAIAYVIRNHTLPVAYDVTNPYISLINFDDIVFRQDAAATVKIRVLVLAGSIALGIFIITAISIFRKPRTETSS